MVKAVGSKRSVFNGKAMHTSGGLVRSQLMRNKWGKIVSVAQHRHGLRMRGNLLPVAGRAHVYQG